MRSTTQLLQEDVILSLEWRAACRPNRHAAPFCSADAVGRRFLANLLNQRSVFNHLR